MNPVQNYFVCSHLLRSLNSALIFISGCFAQIPQRGSIALVPAWLSRASSRGMPRTVPCSCFAGGCEKPRMSCGDGRGIVHPKPQQEEASLLVSQALLSSSDLAHCEWGNNYSTAHPNGQWCGEELIAFGLCGHVEVRTGPVLADRPTFCSCQQSGSGRETLGVRGQS